MVDNPNSWDEGREEAWLIENRQKKDGENKDKKNKRMRESVEARQQQNPTPRQRAKHEAKMADTIPKGEGRSRKN